MKFVSFVLSNEEKKEVYPYKKNERMPTQTIRKIDGKHSFAASLWDLKNQIGCFVLAIKPVELQQWFYTLLELLNACHATLANLELKFEMIEILFYCFTQPVLYCLRWKIFSHTVKDAASFEAYLSGQSIKTYKGQTVLQIFKALDPKYCRQSTLYLHNHCLKVLAW